MAQSKITTIIIHEYIVKIKSKGFIIGTFLGPLGMALFFGLIVFISMMGDDTEKKLAIIDETGVLAQSIVDRDTAKYYLSEKSEEELSKLVQSKEIDGFLKIPADILTNGKAYAFTSGGGGLGFVTSLSNNLEDVVRLKRLQNAGLGFEVIEIVEKGVDITTQKISETGETKEDNVAAFAFVGYILGFVIYFLVFLYGSFVSRGVVEEKSNRIMEVLASSVKPFELMVGKVVGIGMVGLTQVLVWLVMVFFLFQISGTLYQAFGGDIDPVALQQTMQSSSPTMNAEQMDEQSKGMEKAIAVMQDVSPWIGVGFLFYFLAGYFIYATLFAAVGSAVDTEQDAAQLQLPISLPIIATIMMVPKVMENPESGMAIFLSIFPLSSPIVMIVRIAANTVSLWEVVASIVMLVITFFGVLWVAGKIYRIGILMTGKKPKFADLLKWIRM